MRAIAVICLIAAAAVVAQGPPKPEWPTEFDAPFLLYDLPNATPVVGELSHFYYNWDQLESQVISYPTQCVPLLTNGSTKGCRLYFNNNGTYLSQPDLGQQCCLAFPGVGAIPPNFLAGFTWNSNNQTAPDLMGTPHTCNYWEGSGFDYWTDINTGHDVFFNDGGSGAFWAWGAFNVQPQPESIFQLPGTTAQCNTICPIFGEDAMKHLSTLRLIMAAKSLQLEQLLKQ